MLKFYKARNIFNCKKYYLIDLKSVVMFTLIILFNFYIFNVLNSHKLPLAMLDFE